MLSLNRQIEPHQIFRFMTVEVQVQKYFEANLDHWNEEVILKINNVLGSGEFNNVVVGLAKQNFGLILIEESPHIIIKIFYINGKKLLQGNSLKLSLNNPERDVIVFAFSKYLSENFEDLDLINTFNTFQQKTRTLLEKLNYLTLVPTVFEESNSVTIANGVKGVLPVLVLDKIKFYQDIFDKQDTDDINQGNEFIYLMLNVRNNLIKIGTSQKPIFREKTLQSEEPEVVLITYWSAPKMIERELHQQFKIKRQRGEWFKLNFSDLKSIKDKMSKFMCH